MAIGDFRPQPGLNLLAIYEQFQKGRDEGRRNRLADLDEQARGLYGQALSGNKNALASLAGVDPDRYASAKQFMTAQQKAETADFLQAAYSATTPETWKSVVDRFRAKGHEFDPGEDDFANRENLLREGMSIADQEGIKWRQAEAGRDQANADRTFAADQNYKGSQIDIARKELALKGGQGPELVELYDKSRGQPYKARWNAQTQSYDPVGGVKAPNGTQLEVGPDGTVKFNQGMGKPLTEAQGKDTVYATRAEGALPLIDQYGDALTSFGENIASRAPLIGNYMKTPQYQQAQQAGDEFLQAILRKDTGAAITKEEKGEYGVVYLPQPGDSPQVLQQKRVSRRRALEAIQAGMPPQAVLAKERALANTAAATGQGTQNGKTRRGISFEVGE